MKKLKLEIELVPETCWFSNVRSEVTPAQWDLLRKQVYAEAWHTCEICEGVGSQHPVECHEIWEYDDKKLIQKLVGMIALCPNCHMVKHIGMSSMLGKGEQAIAHFMKVNEMTRKQTDQYMLRAFKQWERRSKKKWTLDISILKVYGIDILKNKE